ncbi:MAG: serine/threonine protein kinase [Coriobacteriia bacterium]|nr:serine/threonine protein kinase [Coriobacteriia bacterium]MCL2749706.1 serine/threonine protein kinase [Coriobacteriia bacterium]
MQQPGTVIDGKYEILTALDEGGMSRVYLARDRRLNKQWAVKEIKQSGDKIKDEVIAKSFITEANMIKRLDHSMLPRIVDIISEGDSIFVVMDYIEGQSLDKVISEHGTQSQESVVEWGLQLSDALDYLHTRTPPVIYRDMKPANVMLKPDGTIAIIDFGIAREYKEERTSSNIGDTTILGTRGYAAPEQFGGLGQTDARTDIYCLGATLYHLLTGNSPADPPYEILPIRQVDPSLSPGLERVIAKCTQQNPNQRYQSCAELYYALDNFEKSDEGYFKKLKRKLGFFVAAASLFLVFLIAGFSLMGAHTLVLGNDYDYKLSLASAASNPETAAQYLIEAIEIMPSDLRAYHALIALYKLDNQFTLEEEEQFSSILLRHLGSIQDGSPAYAELAFEIGKLYWYYYTYGQTAGDNQFTRISFAAPWFSDAASIESYEGRQAAQVYRDIAVFETTVTAQISEGSDAGIYLPFYDNLIFLNTLASEEQNDVVSLSVVALTYKTLESYPRKFKAEGLSQTDMLALYNQAFALLRTVHPATEELDLIKEGLVERQGQVRQALDDAYRD